MFIDGGLKFGKACKSGCQRNARHPQRGKDLNHDLTGTIMVVDDKGLDG
jgi:hypothetical protein